MHNVDALMTLIVAADTHDEALILALGMAPSALLDLLDLAHVEVPETRPSNLTLALRVVIAGRGLEECEARKLCLANGRTRPVLVG